MYVSLNIYQLFRTNAPITSYIPYNLTGFHIMRKNVENMKRNAVALGRIGLNTKTKRNLNEGDRL